MAGRKMPSSSSPGLAPLGNSPGSKEKLEGPKVHHDNHGSKDSVPGKGSKAAVPGHAWERHYDVTGASQNMHATEGADFVPKNPSDRKTTHIKVNREDH